MSAATSQSIADVGPLSELFPSRNLNELRLYLSEAKGNLDMAVAMLLGDDLGEDPGQDHSASENEDDGEDEDPVGSVLAKPVSTTNGKAVAGASTSSSSSSGSVAKESEPSKWTLSSSNQPKGESKLQCLISMFPEASPLALAETLEQQQGNIELASDAVLTAGDSYPKRSDVKASNSKRSSPRKRPVETDVELPPPKDPAKSVMVGFTDPDPDFVPTPDYKFECRTVLLNNLELVHHISIDRLMQYFGKYSVVMIELHHDNLVFRRCLIEKTQRPEGLGCRMLSAPRVPTKIVVNNERLKAEIVAYQSAAESCRKFEASSKEVWVAEMENALGWFSNPVGRSPKRMKLDEQNRQDESESKGKGKESVEEAQIECGCCYCEYPMQKITQCEDGHLFCLECSQRAADEVMNTRKTELKCMDVSGCKYRFPEAEVRRFLDPKKYRYWHKLRQEEEIRMANIEGYTTCPFCPFGAIMNTDPKVDKLFQCVNEDCRAVSCRLCRKANHLPLTCEEKEKDKALNAQHTVEEAMTEALLRECPKCHQKFIKTDGCNKMRCSCGQLVCYICKAAISGYDHFNQAPDGRRQEGNCQLWDDLNMRHAQDVAAAAQRALADVKEKAPDVAVQQIAVDVPVIPVPQPHAPGMPNAGNPAARAQAVAAPQPNQARAPAVGTPNPAAAVTADLALQLAAIQQQHVRLVLQHNLLGNPHANHLQVHQEAVRLAAANVAALNAARNAGNPAPVQQAAADLLAQQVRLRQEALRHVEAQQARHAEQLRLHENRVREAAGRQAEQMEAIRAAAQAAQNARVQPPAGRVAEQVRLNEDALRPAARPSRNAPPVPVLPPPAAVGRVLERFSINEAARAAGRPARNAPPAQPVQQAPTLRATGAAINPRQQPAAAAPLPNDQFPAPRAPGQLAAQPPPAAVVIDKRQLRAAAERQEAIKLARKRSGGAYTRAQAAVARADANPVGNADVLEDGEHDEAVGKQTRRGKRGRKLLAAATANRAQGEPVQPVPQPANTQIVQPIQGPQRGSRQEAPQKAKG